MSLSSWHGRGCVAAVLLVLTLGGVAHAQSFGFPWWRDPQFQRDLSLTTEQSSKIDAVFQQTIPTLRQKKTELDAQEEELSKMIAANADESSVTRQVDKVEAIRSNMKERGIDTSAFEKAAPEKAGAKPSEAAKSKPGTAQPVQTIDALFAPLPPVESRGRAWLFVDHQLKSVSLRLGITDGTNTELLTGDLAQNTEVVTGITGVGSTRTSTSGTGTGNPLMPGGGRGPGGFGGAGGRGGR